MNNKVSVITRTKDRGILLKRAVASVLNQTYKNFEQVIVNDGGAESEVESALSHFKDHPHFDKIKVIHHPKSVGMEAASNAGIKASSGDLLIIHDDDDSWDPAFLEISVKEFADDACMGTVTLSMQVDETIAGDEVQITNQFVHNQDLIHLNILKLTSVNQFPPIAFLYRRLVVDKIGMYNEELPVLGDWDFNLRFIAKYPIKVIPQALANYHIRPKSKGAYGNTVVDGLDKHVYYTNWLRDKYFREHFFGKEGLSDNFELLVQFGPALADTLQKLDDLSERLNRIEPMVTTINERGHRLSVRVEELAPKLYWSYQIKHLLKMPFRLLGKLIGRG